MSLRESGTKGADSSMAWGVPQAQTEIALALKTYNEIARDRRRPAAQPAFA
jgi:hypothetical protein